MKKIYIIIALLVVICCIGAYVFFTQERFKEDIQNEPIFSLENYPRVEEKPFDSDRKLMTTVHKINDKYYVFTKGGVDELCSCCSSYQKNGEILTDLENYKKEIDNERNAVS